ncbi:MAG: TonB-dependent receptor [Oscillatoriales cyanobacterium C42_A2020_001]|nr:TonB-dependent receptor [Leptolyngbyaceae cyanobacterium C42_A2020_001]
MDAGLDIVLETADGKPLQVDATKFRSVGNSLIADIPNAALALTNAQAFSADNPTGDIANVRITQVDANTIRVSVTGNNALPKQEVTLKTGGLAYSLNPEADEPDEEIVVTGDRSRYAVPNASTATRTDTPLRDIPQSIQVIPRQVLEDRQVFRVGEAVRNVSGVQQGFSAAGGTESFVIRGFSTFTKLRNGFREEAAIIEETSNVERVEVLKGPASVLYGNLDPGGAINTVTKLPLNQPFYSIGFQAGSFGLIRPTIDLTGPLNAEKTVLYRLNAAYEKDGNFRDFTQGVNRFFISPVLTWKISDRTSITFDLEYLKDTRPYDRGLVAIDNRVADIPFDRVLGEPDDVSRRERVRTGYRLEHQFSDNWTLRNAFSFFHYNNSARGADQAFIGVDQQTGELGRVWLDNIESQNFYGLQTDLIGKFNTGSVKHTLLFGVDLSRNVDDFNGKFDLDNPTFINIFNPVYGQVQRPAREQILSGGFASVTTTDRLGIYLQDQITLAENWKLLIGGRFDLADQRSISEGSETQQQDTAFTPRVGIVYQPIPPLSLYASFSQSFQPNSGTQVNGSLLPPERGTQYEVGVKGEFLNGKLAATLAAFQITKSNVSATDPNNPDFSLPIGEQRSRGVELDIIGEILPGWNIVANYAYTNATVTGNSDSTIIGNRLYSVPYHSASLWTTYQIQAGSLEGFGFGLGLFYVGEREGDLFAPGLVLPSYLRTDASIFYRKNNWRIAINVQNLFDVAYIKETSDRDRIAPGAPFTVVGKVSFEF